MRLGWRQESLQPVLPRSRWFLGIASNWRYSSKIGDIGKKMEILVLKLEVLVKNLQVLDLLYSNMRLVPFPLQQVPLFQIHIYFRTKASLTSCDIKMLTTTLQSWGGKVRAVHIAGSYWAPGFANYLILLQVFLLIHPLQKTVRHTLENAGN